jgi:hypothetical protein
VTQFYPQSTALFTRFLGECFTVHRLRGYEIRPVSDGVSMVVGVIDRIMAWKLPPHVTGPDGGEPANTNLRNLKVRRA